MEMKKDNNALIFTLTISKEMERSQVPQKPRQEFTKNFDSDLICALEYIYIYKKEKRNM
jgi:hypothetical protein